MIHMIVTAKFHGFGLNVRAGERITVSEEQAQHLEDANAARRTEVKPRPFRLQTKPAPSASSPAGRASPRRPLNHVARFPQSR